MTSELGPCGQSGTAFAPGGPAGWGFDPPGYSPRPASGPAYLWMPGWMRT
jgi:hypothetical protein